MATGTETKILIRRCGESEIPALLSLAWKVFSEFESPVYGPEGTAEFRKSLASPEYLAGIEYLGAFDGERLVGEIGFRPDRGHVCFFFVDAPYQRRGIGTRLFRFLQKEYPCKTVTLNSSPYGLPFYKALGFLPTGEERTVNGIRFTPMEKKGEPPMKWNYDYSRTLWMKMFLARPDFPHDRSEVLITFAQALEIIRAVDNLTPGVQKIVYLVGWQGLGHDDCYPEMDVVNEALKRPCDATALESLWWLYEEAKKYRTVVSFHVNVSDAYTATPCFPDLVRANAVVNNMDGVPTPIEIFNGRDGYKTSYRQFWESGIFKRVFDRFCEVTPVVEAGTVHIDNFCIAENLNPRTDVEAQDEARNKMLDDIISRGIDVTSEYTYREAPLRNESPTHPIRKLYTSSGEDMTEVSWASVPLRTLGRIPATWWTSNMTLGDCMEIPPSLYSGHLTDPKLLAVFYGAMHGEDIWMDRGPDPENWAGEFLRQFCTLQLPYFYLNRFDRLSAETRPDGYAVAFSGGVVSEGGPGRITKNGKTLKNGGDVLLPLDEDCQTFVAYSEKGRSGDWEIPDAKGARARISELTPAGSVSLSEARIEDGKIRLTLSPGQALLLELC